MTRSANEFVTSYCNKPHNLSNGVPIGHRCFRLPPGVLKAELVNDFDKAVEILKSIPHIHRSAILRGGNCED